MESSIVISGPKSGPRVQVLKTLGLRLLEPFYILIDVWRNAVKIDGGGGYVKGTCKVRC